MARFAPGVYQRLSMARVIASIPAYHQCFCSTWYMISYSCGSTRPLRELIREQNIFPTVIFEMHFSTGMRSYPISQFCNSIGGGNNCFVGFGLQGIDGLIDIDD